MQTSINAAPAGTCVLQSQQEQINAPCKMRRVVESQYAGLGQNETSEAVELGKEAYKLGETPLRAEMQSLSKISFRPVLRAVSEMNLRCRRPDQKAEQHQDFWAL